MCDTMGRLGKNVSYFAKNSDRSPNEVQLLEYHPRKTGLSGDVACTYLTIPQVETTYEVLLSRPSWMWGAEMGINEWGLVIGNEAVFTKGEYGQSGLTGMDMLRLTLERCRTAKEARDYLIYLLETYGQGGNCGYDHSFYYDNGFLMMDREELYVLQTCGREWVYKQYDRANISNQLSIATEGDAYSGGVAYDFHERHTDVDFTAFCGAASRFAQLCSSLPEADSLEGCMKALRKHAPGLENPFAEGSISSACMHYSGTFGDHSTSSMIVALEKERTVIWLTGCSLPCVSFFKPWLYGTEPVLPVTEPGDPEGKRYWLEMERFRRGLIGKKVPEEYYLQRDEIEARWIEKTPSVSAEDFPAFTQACLREEKAFYERWKDYPFAEDSCDSAYLQGWQKKNEAMESAD